MAAVNFVHSDPGYRFSLLITPEHSFSENEEKFRHRGFKRLNADNLADLCARRFKARFMPPLQLPSHRSMTAQKAVTYSAFAFAAFVDQTVPTSPKPIHDLSGSTRFGKPGR